MRASNTNELNFQSKKYTKRKGKRKRNKKTTDRNAFVAMAEDVRKTRNENKNVERKKNMKENVAAVEWNWTVFCRKNVKQIGMSVACSKNLPNVIKQLTYWAWIWITYSLSTKLSLSLSQRFSLFLGAFKLENAKSFE